MEKQELFTLIDKFLTGNASVLEEQMLFNFYESYQQADIWDQQLPGTQDQALKEVFERLQTAMNDQDIAIDKDAKTFVAPVHRIHFLRRGWFRYAAAALIIICGVGGYFLINNKKAERSVANSNRLLQTDILPGGEKAVLTLADGSKIVLDNAANGNLAQQGNAAIVKLANGQISYNPKGLAGNDVMMNTMATPKGGQYQLTLPDGSKVWLNAASSITFPAAFIGATRNVKITGEVYFEVAKNKEKPFIVDVDGKSSIQVLGTSFNINSYEDESAIKTTLIEGSVRVANGSRQTILKPGQQAQITNAAGISVISDADLDQTLAWKNGIFNFNRLDVRAVMAQLARWYDINIQYKSSISNNFRFKGEMYRNVNLSDVLEMLERMKLKLKLEGKTLIVF